jgi:surface antigen
MQTQTQKSPQWFPNRKTLAWIFAAVILVSLSFCKQNEASGTLAKVKTKLKKVDLNPTHAIGDKIDSLNGVYVFYNGSVGNVSGRNTTADGYNLGLQYQCVEFIKRYYWQHLKHKMPDTYGHAKDFFAQNLADGRMNTTRDLLQYQNPSASAPQVNDLVVFSETDFNPYGHVAIVSKVEKDQIEIIQQNMGPFGSSRAVLALKFETGKWRIKEEDALGWLRKR